MGGNSRKILQVGDVRIGEGLPKICISIAGKTPEEIIRLVKKGEREPGSLYEWRADYLLDRGYRDLSLQRRIIEEIQGLTSRPVIYTLRTGEEGGAATLSKRDYYTIIRDVILECTPEIIDIEAFDRDEGYNKDKIRYLVDLAHEKGKKVILSNHEFHMTPDGEEILRRLILMDEMGGDIPKIAVMPQEERDVLVLLEAARLAGENVLQGPFVALSMGELGKSSRVCGGSFGSAITFAAGGEITAPGQMNGTELHRCICEYYGNHI